MLRVILNKYRRQYPTMHQLYGHLPPITKTIKIRRTGHTGHFWRSRDELMSDVLLWIPLHGRIKAGRPARTYVQQLCADSGCSPEDLQEAMDGSERWQETVWYICADSTTWWWWWLWSTGFNFQTTNVFDYFCYGRIQTYKIEVPEWDYDTVVKSLTNWWKVQRPSRYHNNYLSCVV